MVSGSSSSCRGGRQVGRGNHGEKDEAAKRLSDRGRIRASRKYTNRGMTPPPAYNRRESSFYARRTAHASTWSRSARASTSSPPRVGDLEADRVAVEFEVVPGYAPGDYVKDADIDNVLEIGRAHV